MAFAPHARVSFGGNLNIFGTAGVDIWNCNINVVMSDFTEAGCDAYLAAIQANLKTWFTGVNNEMSNLSDLRYVKCNRIGADGKYMNPSLTHRFDYTSIGTGPKAPSMPGYLTLAYSWSTAQMRGAGSKGRIYPPNAPTAAAGGQPIALASSIANAVNSAKSLLTLIGSAGVTATTPVIASGVNAALTPITGVRVGNEIDVQRRRRNALPEVYSAAAWP